MLIAVARRHAGRVGPVRDHHWQHYVEQHIHVDIVDEDFHHNAHVHVHIHVDVHVDIDDAARHDAAARADGALPDRRVLHAQYQRGQQCGPSFVGW